MEIPSGLPADVDRLVREDLVPGFDAGQPRLPLRVSARHPYGQAVPWTVEPDDHVDPFLLASDGSILAGRLRRSTEEGDAGAQVWVLPAWVSRPREWVKAAWSEWSKDALQPLPPPPSWADSSSWHSPKEVVVARRRRDLTQRREEAQRAFDAEEDELHRDEERERDDADAGVRRLLTRQGEELATAVSRALTDLGFAVREMDDERPAGDKLEDLRLTSQDLEDWEALVEVRGYRRGAQAKDFMKMARFARRYALAERREPSAQWYIVNAEVSIDPALRRIPLASEPDLVREFGAESCGLVLPTTQLYQLWRAVGLGEMTAEGARHLLTSSQGRLPDEAMARLSTGDAPPR